MGRFQVFSCFFAIILLIASASEEKTEPKQQNCWRNSKTWPHARCFHSSVCHHHCRTLESAISGQCASFFRKCQCKFCEELPQPRN
ncbi:hypothetical protein PIB30_008147 [Stylosanthes scabra]|uniref:Knottin scorpion toxin-like domain-containing protein n=1 Tax=Stylosanthes scabra TaxID=79078 RepID=A0ABU6Y3K3_9FABA|nr:hypothetical protein [Stylosanthes scabra]